MLARGANSKQSAPSSSVLPEVNERFSDTVSNNSLLFSFSCTILLNLFFAVSSCERLSTLKRGPQKGHFSMRCERKKECEEKNTPDMKQIQILKGGGGRSEYTD